MKPRTRWVQIREAKRRRTLISLVRSRVCRSGTAFNPKQFIPLPHISLPPLYAHQNTKRKRPRPTASQHRSMYSAPHHATTHAHCVHRLAIWSHTAESRLATGAAAARRAAQLALLPRPQDRVAAGALLLQLLLSRLLCWVKPRSMVQQAVLGAPPHARQSPAGACTAAQHAWAWGDHGARGWVLTAPWTVSQSVCQSRGAWRQLPHHHNAERSRGEATASQRAAPMPEE